MSEISDAVQIVRVAFDGIEVAMKVGSGSIEMMQKALSFLYGMLEYEKQMGKTSMKKLLMKGGDLQILQFQKEDMKKVEKFAKKYGILYSVLPDLDRKDGMCEVLFHSEATPRVQMMIQKMKSARVTNMDEYLSQGNEAQLGKLMKFFEEQKKGNVDIHTDAKFDNLIQKVGQYAMDKKSVSVDAVKKDFSIDESKAEELLAQLLKIGVVDKPDSDGHYKVIMDKSDFESRMQRFQELSNRMKTIAASKNTNLVDITITRKLVVEENDHAVKTRIPGTWGEKAQYLWLNKSDIMEIHNGKTLLSYLDKKKDYKIYSKDNHVIHTMPGETLFGTHYDAVEKTVRERYEKVKEVTKDAKISAEVKRR